METIVLIVFCLLTIWGSRAFRRGRPGAYRDVYDNPGLPIQIRNLPVLAQFYALALLPLLVLAELAAGPVPAPVAVTFEVEGFLIFGGWGYLLIVVGLSLVWLGRPPRPLLPTWVSHPLVAQRGIVGRIAIVAAVLLVTVGMGFIVFAVLVLAGLRPIHPLS